MKERYRNIEIMKAIGIFLVVLGHSFPDASNALGIQNALFRVVHQIIYSFHMPLMFFVSGFLSKRALDKEQKGYIKDRVRRLLIPYLVVGLIYAPFKLILSKYANNYYDIKKIWQMFFGENPDGGLWYLYSLFLIQVIMYCFVTAGNLRKFVLISGLVSMSVFLLDISFYRIDDTIYYLFFALLGLCFRDNYGKKESATARKYIMILAFICCEFVLLFFDVKWIKFFCGIFAIMVIWELANSFGKKKDEKSFVKNGIEKVCVILSEYSMDIYIFHGIIMVAIRIVLWSILRVNYYVCCLSMLVGGLLLSMLISKYMVRKIKIMRTLFLGSK